MGYGPRGYIFGQGIARMELSICETLVSRNWNLDHFRFPPSQGPVPLPPHGSQAASMTFKSLRPSNNRGAASRYVFNITPCPARPNSSRHRSSSVWPLRNAKASVVSRTIRGQMTGRWNSQFLAGRRRTRKLPARQNKIPTNVAACQRRPSKQVDIRSATIGMAALAYPARSAPIRPIRVR